VMNPDLASFVTNFYQSGGPRISPDAFAWFLRLWVTATVVFTALYAKQTIHSVRKGHSPNPVKFAFIAATFVYLSYTSSVATRPLIGLALFESWHDIQYLAIVWMFNLNRNRQTAEAGSFIRFLFRPRVALVLLYVGACLAFGSLTHA